MLTDGGPRFYDVFPQELPSHSRQSAVFEAMNIPNSLTVFRILLIPVFVVLLFSREYDYCLVALLLAGLTDGLDGIIARVTNQRTRLGAFLDPLADKLLLSSGFVTLAILQLIPVWVVSLVVTRDLMLMTGTVVAKIGEMKLELSPTVLGKGTTVLQLVYIVLVVLLSAQEIELRFLQPVMYLMVLFTLGSGIHYFYRGFAGLAPRRARSHDHSQQGH